MKPSFRTSLTFFLLFIFSGCATITDIIQVKPKNDVYLTQGGLAKLIVENLDTNRIKKSSLYKAVTLPPKVSSLKNWLETSKEAALIRESNQGEAIISFLSLNLPSFPFYADEVWNPNREVSRGKFALFLLDVLIMLKNDKGLLNEFNGQKSPYKDINGNSTYFPAVMVSSSRGLMQAFKTADSTFEPERLIQYKTAEQAIQKLKQFFP
ncbi:MAG: hypothetical protein HQK84_01845 [Nitrospinae bacterium]|nr:hypothetical protein [Nitrospinota bacterium]